MDTGIFTFFGLVITTLVLSYCVAQIHGQTYDSRESYCGRRHFPRCCSGRQDFCSVPISTTKCYCDDFCKRHHNSDCCPDYDSVCQGKYPYVPVTKAPSPPQLPIIACVHKNQYYPVGHRIKDGCQECTCTAFTWYNATMDCKNVCNFIPLKPSLIVYANNVADKINQGNFGWQATNYHFLSGRTIGDVFRTKAGVCRSSPTTFNYTIPSHLWPINYDREEFDARQKWPGLIQPIHDQMEHPSSWAFSTAEAAADRMAIRTGGSEKRTLSVQNLISCVYQTSYCSSTEQAWRHIRNYGIASENCYPLTTNTFNSKGHCKVPTGEKVQTVKCPSGKHEGLLYRLPWHYLVNGNETDIRKEILANGPVQAHLKAKSDFFFYRSGVYKHIYGEQINGGANHYIAVRIIGWGVDRSSGFHRKYWLCTNSWGTQWGENGYFRIARGENEGDIESYVYGVWPEQPDTS